MKERKAHRLRKIEAKRWKAAERVGQEQSEGVMEQREKEKATQGDGAAALQKVARLS